jgi:hypothetical protein
MARTNPVAISEIRRDKHDQMISDMQDALYNLSDKIRKPYPRAGEKLLPGDLQEGEKPEAKAARRHIELLHKGFKSAKGK